MSPSLRNDLNELWTVSKALQEYLETSNEPQALERPPRLGPIVGAGCNTVRGACTNPGPNIPPTTEDVLNIVRWMNERFGGLLSGPDI